MKFSIIIPVYQVEKYIEKCLQSIIDQKYSDYEIIIVDDGSKDTSGQICDAYAERYDHIRVIHIPNGGVSNARNLGLAQAQGDYVWFIDSDDYLEPDAFTTLESHIETFQKPDLLIFDAKVVDENGDLQGEITTNFPPKTRLCFDANREFVYANTSLWNRLYKRQLIEQARLSFEPKISIAEDLLFNFKYLLEAETIYYVKDALYYYIQRKNSAMSGAGKNDHVKSVFEKLISYYKKKGQYQFYRQEIEYLAIYHYFITTSVRMIRCGVDSEQCRKVAEWFHQQGIALSMDNPYVRNMAKKHILVFLLLKWKLYFVVSMLFSKF